MAETTTLSDSPGVGTGPRAPVIMLQEQGAGLRPAGIWKKGQDTQGEEPEQVPGAEPAATWVPEGFACLSRATALSTGLVLNPGQPTLSSCLCHAALCPAPGALPGGQGPCTPTPSITADITG